MKVLVACEFSGVVREAFAKLGHDAWSCDLLPTEIPGKHFECDIFEVINMGWDLMIAHPPCTYLAVSGNRYYAKSDLRKEAIKFVEKLWDVPVERICIENPIGVLSTQSTLGKPTQIIQPWQFGHGETKATCFWLKNLPKLIPTEVVNGREPRIHYMSPSPNRWKERSRTYIGIANAMAEQWSNL
jgi:hypothetical protein